MKLSDYYSRLPDREYSDFRDFLEKSCGRGGERPAFRWCPNCEGPEQVLSFAELRSGADALGRRLLALGLKRGDRVGLIAENRPEWCLVYLGVTAAGFIIVPLDVALDDEGLKRNLAAAHVRALFTSQKQIRRHPALADPRALGLELLADFDVPAAPGAEAFGVSLAIGRSRPDIALPKPGEVGPDAPAVVFFTSGTTGIAKGIMLSQKALIANVNAARMSLIVDERDVFVAILPLHHTYATTCSFLSSVEAGCATVIVDRFAPSAIVKVVGEGRVSFFIGVPLLFDKLRAGIESKVAEMPRPARRAFRAGLRWSRFCTLRLGIPVGRVLFQPIRAKAGLGSVRLAVSGGGPLSIETAEFFDAIGIPIVQGYGMSENGPLISVNLPERKDNRSVGFPVKYTEVRIADRGSDGVGQIEVRGPSMMIGYLDDPRATKEAFTADGWLKTGDLGRIDFRGFLFITGRLKSLIVTEGGKNVYPEEIEGKLSDSPWVKEVLVIGRPMAPGHSGEDVVAVLYPDFDKVSFAYPGKETDQAFVRSLIKADIVSVNKSLASYEKISDFIIRSEPFIKTSSGKIRRFIYAEEYSGRGSTRR